MIRPLRRVHRAIFVVLAIALPLVLAIALAGRRPVSVNRVPPAAGRLP